jgi:hypothetical protein
VANALDRWDQEGGAPAVPLPLPYEPGDLLEVEGRVLECLGAALRPRLAGEHPFYHVALSRRETGEVSRRRFPYLQQLVRILRQFESALDACDEFLAADRLFDEIQRARFHRLSLILGPVVGALEFSAIAVRMRAAPPLASRIVAVPWTHVEWIDVAASHLAMEATDVRGNFRPLALVPLDLNLPIATASGTRPCSDWHGTGTGSEAETQTPRDRRICGIRRCRRIPSSERRSRTEPVRRRQARRAALPSARQRERGNQRRRNRIPPKDVRAHSSGYIPLSAAGVSAFAWCLGC